MPSACAVDENSHHIMIVVFAERKSGFSFLSSGSALVYEFPKLIMSAFSLSHVFATPQLPRRY